MLYSMQKEFEENFGKLTGKQLWVLIKFAKQVRLRCRNNTAFNNFCNMNFPHARFKQITKTGPKGTYEGLSITVDGEEFKPELPKEGD